MSDTAAKQVRYSCDTSVTQLRQKSDITLTGAAGPADASHLQRVSGQGTWDIIDRQTQLRHTHMQFLQLCRTCVVVVSHLCHSCL